MTTKRLLDARRRRHALPRGFGWIVHRLVVPEREKRRALLQDSGGALTSEEAEALEQALQDCRRIDPGEW